MTGPEIAQMFLEQDGYVVMGCKTSHLVGDVIWDQDLEKTSEAPGPWVVVDIATVEDFKRQMSLVPPEDQWNVSIETTKVNFYKVIAE